MPQTTCIAITPGEPAGVGPELSLKLAQHTLGYEIVAIANMHMLQQQATQLNLNVQIKPFDELDNNAVHEPGQLKVIDVDMPHHSEPGILNSANSNYVIDTLDTAISLVQNNSMHALCTAPVQKSIINDAGIPFTGHTEFIAEKTGGFPVMLLASETQESKNSSSLRVALVTTHIPVCEVAAHITESRIEKTLNVLHQDLISRFDIANPCIAVCGLNPHAGENGHLGNEEKQIITPVLNKLRTRGLNIIGPLAADTAFTQQQLMGKDVIVAMYHDQGLPVIKHQGFGEIVNVTLGLPIIRTSVDHGTALDIAGQGIADESSLVTAANLAAKLSIHSQI